MKYNLHISARHLSLAVCVLDAFTKKILRSKDLCVSIAKEAPPLKKEDGYFVFMNLREQQVTLSIREPRYLTQIISLRLSELSLEEPFLYIYLTPGSNYPFPPATAYLSGKASKGSLIRLFYPQIPCETLFLKQDYTKNSSQIVLHASSPSTVCGNTFCIKNLDGIQDFFTPQTLVDAKEGRYRLTVPLPNSYTCQDTTIFSVFTSQSNDQNTYFLPLLLPRPEGEILCEISCSGKNQLTKKLPLKAGEKKELNFV